MNITDKIELINADCLDVIKTIPDKSYDLALIDPPYWADEECTGAIRTTGNVQSKLNLGGQPTKEFWMELNRVSKHQIVFGANNFGFPFKGFIVWDKTNIPDEFTLSKCELASVSEGLSKVAKIYRCSSAARGGEKRFHPCLPAGQKVFFNNVWVDIEAVEVGDKNNYGTVIAKTAHTAENLVELTVGGQSVTSTYNHPFLILRGNEIAWCEAGLITTNDYILWNENLQKKDILDTTTKDVCDSNIISFGNSITGESQKDTKSTILTEIKQIIELKTSNLSLQLSTSGYTVVANLLMENGINHVVYVESTSRVQESIGISKRQDGLLKECASLAISDTLSKYVKCSLQKVGSVKTIQEKTKVYNLTIAGVPAFDTLVGISHNTSKPVELYEWILMKYAKDGWKILDTHLGSASSAIACHNLGFEFLGIELDKNYYEKSVKRVKMHTAQLKLF